MNYFVDLTIVPANLNSTNRRTMLRSLEGRNKSKTHLIDLRDDTIMKLGLSLDSTDDWRHLGQIIILIDLFLIHLEINST